MPRALRMPHLESVDVLRGCICAFQLQAHPDALRGSLDPIIRNKEEFVTHVFELATKKWHTKVLSDGTAYSRAIKSRTAEDNMQWLSQHAAQKPG